MELALAEKERENRIKALRESRDEAWQREQVKQTEADRLELEKLIKLRHAALLESTLKSQLLSKSSLRSAVANNKHRRQNSDPLKFSLIDEDLDLESWLRRYGLAEGSISVGGKYSPQLMSSVNTLRKTRPSKADSRTATRRWDERDEQCSNFGGTLPLPRKTARDATYTSQNHKSMSRSTEMLAKLTMLDKHGNLVLSQSESSLPLTVIPSLMSRTPTYFSDGDDGDVGISDARIREERKLQLQMEIGLRKLQLEETQYLQNELRKLAEMPDITPVDMEKARSLYQQRIKMREQVCRTNYRHLFCFNM